MSERFPNFPAGTRVRITEAYNMAGPDGEPDPEAAAFVGKEGAVVPGGNVYIRVLLDGQTQSELFTEAELEVIPADALEPLDTVDDLARELYTLIVVRGKWQGVPKPSAIVEGDDGTYDTQGRFVKEAWREYAKEIALRNFLTLGNS